MNLKCALGVLPALVLACSSTPAPGDSNNGGTGGTAGGTGGTAMGGTGNAATGGTGNAATGGTGNTAMGGTSGGGQCVTGTVKVDTANNYTFTSDIKLTPMPVKPNDPNLTIDWSGVTTDFLGRPLDPKADIDSVLLAVFGLSVEDFEKHLNDDDGVILTSNQGGLEVITDHTATTANLQDLYIPGQPQNTYKTSDDVKKGVDDYLNPDLVTPTMPRILAVMAQEGTNPGSGARMIQLFTVDPSSTTTTIALGSNTLLPNGTDGHTGGTTGPSMSVTYDANLHQLTPLKVMPGDTNLTIDWSGLTKNGLGRDFIPRSLYRLTVGHYTQSITELENQFLNIDALGTTYSEDVPSDEPLSLAGLKDSSGNAFTGIDGTGTWILALFCDPAYCANPAPWFLTVLSPCN